MKKIKYLLLFTLLLFGCNSSKNDLEEIQKHLNDTIPTTMEESYNLPKNIEGYDASITWQSSNLEVIDNDGNLTLPIEDCDVTLSYLISLNKKEVNGTIIVHVKSNIAKELDEINSWLQTNVPTVTDTDINLPTKHPSITSSIVWSSDKIDVLSNTGKYTSPINDTENVLLSYEININNYKKVGSILITVNISNNEKSLRNINNCYEWLNEQIPTSLSESIVFPKDNDFNCLVKILSSDTNILDNNGNIQNISKDTNITLTFIISDELNEKVFTKNITINVNPNISIDKCWSWLNSITPDETIVAITIPNKNEEFNCTIDVTSNNDLVLSPNGIINIPENNTEVIFTYKIICNENTKTFNKTILVRNIKITDDYFSEIEQYINNNTPKTIIFDTEFVTSYLDTDVIISWTTSDPDLISNTGKLLDIEGRYDEVLLTYEINLYNYIKKGEIWVEVIDMTVDDIAKEFKDQFRATITKDRTIITDFYEDFTITWYSSHPEIFSNEGVFVKPVNDTVVTIYFTICFKDQSWSYEVTVDTKGIPLATKLDEINNWILNDILPDRAIFPGTLLTLPLVYDELDATIFWSSSNSNVINEQGQIIHFAFDRYVDLIANIEVGGVNTSISFSLVIKAIENLSLEEKINSYLQAVGLTSIDKVNFSSGGVYTNISQSYNKLSFYNNEEINIVEQIAPLSDENRPGTKLYSVEFIVVHDTANNGSTANAKAHANYVENGGGGTSWHYSVDQDGAYHQIPDDEVAYHAGSGSTQFVLINSLVKVTKTIPVITITNDGYYAFNGEKSVITAPLISEKIPTTDKITPTGLYVTIKDGYYYMNGSYYNSGFGLISNNGGNRNAIGIETCVNNGSDYIKTVHVNALLVADLCIDNNLDIDRVYQHNNFSGKDCPGAIREIGYWNEFLDLVSMYKFVKENLSEVNFEWKSDSDILADDGIISLDLNNQNEVKYHVIVTYKDNTFTKEFTTKLK